MKRFILLLTLLFVTAACGQTASDLLGPRRTYIGSGNATYDPLYKWANWMQGQVVAGGSVGTGSVFYVDSNVSNEGDGTSWATAKDTLDEAVGLCTADNGDIIMIAQGSTEALGTGTDVVDIDVDGVTITQCGDPFISNGFDYTDYDTGSFAIGADNVTLYNMRFHANVTDVNEAIEVEAGSTDVRILSCIFDVEAEGTDEFHEVITSHGAASDRPKIVDCVFRMGAGGARSGISFKDMDYAEIGGNIFTGDFAVADVNNATTASNHIVIRNNLFFQGTIGGNAGLNDQPAIELLSTTTGIIANNYICTDMASFGAMVVAADCFLFENYANEDEGSAGTGALVGTASVAGD